MQIFTEENRAGQLDSHVVIELECSKSKWFSYKISLLYKYTNTEICNMIITCAINQHTF